MTQRTAGEAESMLQHLLGRLLASGATCLLFASLAILTARSVHAQDADFFVQQVRPIFQQRCYGCHGSKSQKSDLRLDVRSAAMRGGQIYGEPWIAGDPESSPLIQVVESLDPAERMPPEGEPLSAAQKEILRQWIAQGSIWPEGVDEAQEVDRGAWWSLQPLDVPTGLVGIDELIDEVLASKALKRSPPATKSQWLRRVTLDLTGLLPTPQELEQFLEDSREDAWERVVDRLLASPRYGERWGQHWLDVVRYADTHGFEVNTERPNAWPYRDYVIDAWNRDLPYDRFIQEQIAGDQRGVDEATGFLITASVLLPGQIGNNIGQTFLGLSVGCARCHDHKFDPITARDYYAMQAFVAGVEYLDRPWRNRSLLSDPESLGRLTDQLRQARLPLLEGVPVGTQAARRPRINAARSSFVSKCWRPIAWNHASMNWRSSICQGRTSPWRLEAPSFGRLVIASTRGGTNCGLCMTACMAMRAAG
jgi:mono/diheme cytochrome c family protein